MTKPSRSDMRSDDPGKQAPGDTSAVPAAPGASGVEGQGQDVTAQVSAELNEGLAQVLNAGLAQVSASLPEGSSLKQAAGALLESFKRTRDALDAEWASVLQRKQDLETLQRELHRKEREVVAAIGERDRGFAQERANLRGELQAQRNALHAELERQRSDCFKALSEELAEVRAKRLAEVAEAEKAERLRFQAQREQERDAWDAAHTAERTALIAEIAQERTDWDAKRNAQQAALQQHQEELERQKGAVAALQAAVDGKRVELDDSELDLERRRSRLTTEFQRRKDEIDEEVGRLLDEERKSLERAKDDAIAEAARLRATVQSQTELVGAFRHLEAQLGGRNPGEVIRDLKLQADRIKALTEELAGRPTEEVRAQFRGLEDANKKLQARVLQLEDSLAREQTLAGQARALERENFRLGALNQSLEQTANIYEATATRAEAELNRLRAAYERPAERETRYREIELPIVSATQISELPKRAATKEGDRVLTKTVDEVEWLDGIARASESYGLRFHPRILKAFHTSLKTAEWSPLTILAGVSGTGKSELPRLYSHFGGLFFHPLAVQPNWDSQESMLGFFNSIDNRFDAQPVLRFLAQSQKAALPDTERGEGYPGLAGAVCLVLLDEMNLAHPEQYWAEFLSKLELRRGMKGADVPRLPVKIGAGMEPYQLPLGRNVLWAGTMNQDETTKSLSDKVLDRSIIIHFPRPMRLERRVKLAPLDARNRGATLPISAWQSWIVQGSRFTDEEVKPFREFIEAMNTSLAKAGRAIGHRVWQSVEYYMANYPDVRAAGEDATKKAQAMHDAFEDQLVQKVMPKLRGIDTRGKSKDECLDKIKGQLVAGVGGERFSEGLALDFDLATELGDGQFIWRSANYIVGEQVPPAPPPAGPGAEKPA